MSKHEIDIMWQQAMRQSIEEGEMFTRYHFAKLVAERALSDPMREVQRLGQEIEQEPVGMVKDLFTSTAWERLDVRGSTKVYLDIPPQPEQEPVATLEDLEQEIYQNTRNFISRDVMEWMLRRYYTTPPQRTWVGLTEQDLDYLCNLAYTGDEEFALAVQAKLMEKNA
jgi:hypothetical protein